MELIDTHCHLDVPQFSKVLPDILARAKAAGIKTFINPGVTRAGWPKILSLCSHHQEIFGALGLHPLYLEYHKSEHLDTLEELCSDAKIIALGEIGLDYYHANADREMQLLLFVEQLNIAQKLQLPVLLHVRKAHDQVLATLRRKKFCYGGIVHAYSGSKQQAEQYIKLGFTIGVGGTITYPRARRIRAIAASLPETSIVLETDAPDIVVASHKGESNMPEYLKEVLHTLAILRDEELDYTATYTSTNARKMLKLQIKF